MRLIAITRLTDLIKILRKQVNNVIGTNPLEYLHSFSARCSTELHFQKSYALKYEISQQVSLSSAVRSWALAACIIFADMLHLLSLVLLSLCFSRQLLHYLGAS